PPARSDVTNPISVEAVIAVGLLQQLADDVRAVRAGILGDQAGRGGERPADDVDDNLLVAVFGLQPSERLGAMEEGDAAAGDDAFLDRGAGRVHGVLDPVLALLHFGFRGAAYPDDGDTAGQLRR